MSINVLDARPAKVEAGSLTLTERIIRYYQEAGMDYEHWSRNFNMHFGYFRWGLNPFDRETMLEQMNAEIAERLRIDAEKPAFLLDLGCGVGATARHIARRFNNVKIIGATIVPWQVEKGFELNLAANLTEKVEIINADYRNLPCADACADGVYVAESSCHDDSLHKERVIAEAARTLKSGGRFVIADCFIKKPERKFNVVHQKCYDAICENWALPDMACLSGFTDTLEKHGFTDIEVKDISWQIAPSVAHAPFAVLTFIIKKFFAGEKLKRQSVNNLKGSLLALILGMNRAKFSYCLISAVKSGR